MTTQSGVYQIRHVESGRAYVGSAVNIRDRWRQHERHLRKRCHHSRFLQRAWNKYSSVAFAWEVLEVVADKAELIAREQAWIDRTPKHARYNTSPTAGSSLGVKLTTETREKLSAANKGRKHSPESRAKMSAAFKGRERSEEHRAKLSARARARWADPDARAKIMETVSTPEYRAKKSAIIRMAGNWNAKLTEADVRDIRGLARIRCPKPLIARMKGVKRCTVYDVLSFRSWSHVD